MTDPEAFRQVLVPDDLLRRLDLAWRDMPGLEDLGSVELRRDYMVRVICEAYLTDLEIQ